MRCEECGSDDMVPIVYGAPDSEMWRAMLLGNVHLGGSIASDGRAHWYCSNCSHDSIGDSIVEYDQNVSMAFHTQEMIQIDPSVDAIGLMMGRRVAQRTLFGFAKLGASDVKVVDSTSGVRVLAFIDNEWSEFDWPLGKYLPEMMQAFRLNQIRERIVVDSITYLIEVSELTDGDRGLSFHLSMSERKMQRGQRRS